LFAGINFKADFLKQKATRQLFPKEQHLPSPVIDRGSLRSWQEGAPGRLCPRPRPGRRAACRLPAAAACEAQVDGLHTLVRASLARRVWRNCLQFGKGFTTEVGTEVTQALDSVFIPQGKFVYLGDLVPVVRISFEFAELCGGNIKMRDSTVLPDLRMLPSGAAAARGLRSAAHR
jgi:hypothetical protein